MNQTAAEESSFSSMQRVTAQNENLLICVRNEKVFTSLGRLQAERLQRIKQLQTSYKCTHVEEGSCTTVAHGRTYVYTAV